MDKRPFSYDPTTGVRETFYYDDAEKRFYIEATQDVGALLDINKAKYAQTDERARFGDWAKVASIPNVVLMEYRKRGIDLLRDREALKKFLNDSDNRYFRTRPGRI